MKSVTCDLCEFVVQADTFEDWMEALKPHYQSAHKDVMSDPSKTKADMEQWMADNKARFEASA